MEYEFRCSFDSYACDMNVESDQVAAYFTAPEDSDNCSCEIFYKIKAPVSETYIILKSLHTVERIDLVALSPFNDEYVGDVEHLGRCELNIFVAES